MARLTAERWKEIEKEINHSYDWFCSDWIKSIARDLFFEVDALRDESLAWKMTSKVGWAGSDQMEEDLRVALNKLRIAEDTLDRIHREISMRTDQQIHDYAKDALMIIRDKKEPSTFPAEKEK
jgi:hypothetical protein